MAVYKSITPIDFYVLYNVLRLYFLKGYNIEKYGIASKRIERRFVDDRLKNVYVYLASKIPTRQDAIFLICSNFIANSNNYITSFSLDSCYNKDLKRYYTNKRAIIDDFDVLVQSYDIINKTNSGELADDVIIRKQNFVLFVYINKILPFVTLSRSKSKKPEAVLDLFYGGVNKKSSKREEDSLFDKVSYFISIDEAQTKQLAVSLSSIVERERVKHQTENQTENQTEDIPYDNFYC